ncbi:MAG: Holliday junction branch migration protein RuvA [Patescibacteria group bacterium]|nr:Holliday junction branch migration protein RuvA [Patescibacteria group bacterium]MDD3434963.1 Holliday junction branch migration protein RuvA [Patescibacteria group bacterium]MDD4466612.1 Holliday junction branch migration protein RuvA [Patescibacteria group bacterium]
MIAYLEGQVIDKTETYFILETGGVGYQVFAGENFLATVKKGQRQIVFVHHRVREEASDLYGFARLSDLELFELLISVSGVGPKSALAVLSLASAEDVKTAIIHGDASLLTKVSGIGKKTAERLILELKNKILKISPESKNDSDFTGLNDELDALLSLGYSVNDARLALNQVGPEFSSTAMRLKAALRYLAR